MLPNVAEIVVEPVDALAVAKPPLVIVATVVDDDFHVTELVMSCVLLSLYLPVALNCCVSPLGTDGVAGVTVIDTRDGGSTVKLIPLLAFPPTVTTTLPVVAPEGTGATIFVLLQLVGVAGVPLNVTVLVPCVEPKLEPLMVTDVVTDPEVGERLVMTRNTVKVTPLLATPLTVTTTAPVVAPVGTGTTMLVMLQLVGVAVVPLNFTVLVPWVAPKFEPLMVTDAPTAPAFGDRLVMIAGTVKLTPLLALPPTVTTTGPVVAPEGTGATIFVLLQLVGVAVVPLNLIVLVPWVEPKLDPLMVTAAPMAPELGERLLMTGKTVNVTPLLELPLTVATTVPVVAPEGTGATIFVLLQLVGVAAVPLNFTVLVPCVNPKLDPLMVTAAPMAPEVGERLLMVGAAAANETPQKSTATNVMYATQPLVRFTL